MYNRIFILIITAFIKFIKNFKQRIFCYNFNFSKIQRQRIFYYNFDFLKIQRQRIFCYDFDFLKIQRQRIFLMIRFLIYSFLIFFGLTMLCEFLFIILCFRLDNLMYTKFLIILNLNFYFLDHAMFFHF